MDNLPDNIYFKDRDSRFLRINKALADLFGLNSPEEAIGKTDFDFFTAEHAGPALHDERQILDTKIPVVGRVEKETWTERADRWVPHHETADVRHGWARNRHLWDLA